MLEILLKVRSFERGLSKSLKIFFFLSNPVLFDGQSYQKQKVPEASDQPFFRLHNKFGIITLLVTCYLTKFDDII